MRKSKSEKTAQHKEKRAKLMREQYGTKVKITMQRGKNKETWIATPLMEKEVRKAIRAYARGKIYRHEVQEHAKATFEGKESKHFQRLFKRVARREKLTTALPFKNNTISLGRFTTEEARGARPVYEKLAKHLTKRDTTEIIIQNRSKVDRGFIYTIHPLTTSGESVGKLVCRRVAPESVAMLMEHIKTLAANGKMPEYIEDDADRDLIWGNMPQRARLSMEFDKTKPSKLNHMLGGFKTSIVFVRPW